jgi:small-conductance mechanosensitive channel
MEGFLIAPRTIGSFHFSYGSVLLFFLIIYLASLLSSIINYFMGSGHQTLQSQGRSRFGGFVLIIRLCILAFGFLIAIAAAGIPIDKMTIILGALGVGIGFGLQNIVNNLVSGIIIAFEKPIHVGDQIEVGGRLGKVMEIGMRSSKLATFEGSEVIIPNGDLLSQHLVNWTLSSNNRRVEINLGVKYGSDLEKVNHLLMDLLKSKESIMPIPKPQVLLNEFGGNGIGYRLLFWANDIGNWLTLKSEVIQEIDKAFKENGIDLAISQQDFYIKELPKVDPV